MNVVIFSCILLNVCTGLQRPKRNVDVEIEPLIKPSEIQRLKNDLQSYEDERMRPVKNMSTKTTVQMSFYIFGINNIDDHQQTVKITMGATLNWKSAFFQWDPYNYSGIIVLEYDWYDVWTPDIEYNSYPRMRRSFSPTLNPLTVNAFGYVNYFYRAQLTIPCKFDFYNFPKDVQTCTLAVYSYMYTLNEVDLDFVDENSVEFGLLEYGTGKKRYTGWEIIKVTQEKAYSTEDPRGFSKIRPVEERDTMPILFVKFTFARREPYFIVTEIIPFVVTSLLTLSIFWINGEIVVISITLINILIQGLLSYVLLMELPAGSGKTPKILIIYGIHFCMSGLSFFIVLIMESLRYLSVKLPVTIEVWIGKLTKLRFFRIKSFSITIGGKFEEENKEKNYDKFVYQSFLQLLLKLVFLLYSFVYTVLLICLLF